MTKPRHGASAFRSLLTSSLPSRWERRSRVLPAAFYAYFTQFIVDSFGFIVSVMLMAMVVIGGTGSTWGVVCAAILLTLLPEMFRFINDYRLLIFGGLLVLMMRFAPGGLAGIGKAALAGVRR